METPPGGGNKRRFENWLRETFAGKIFHFCSRLVFGQFSKVACLRSKSDLSSTTKCDPNHIGDNYAFGHT